MSFHGYVTYHMCLSYLIWLSKLPCCDANVAVDSSVSARRAQSGSGEARLESARW